MNGRWSSHLTSAAFAENCRRIHAAHGVRIDEGYDYDPAAPRIDEVAGRGGYYAELWEDGRLFLELGPDEFTVSVERYGFLGLRTRLRFVRTEESTR